MACPEAEPGAGSQDGQEGWPEQTLRLASLLLRDKWPSDALSALCV